MQRQRAVGPEPIRREKNSMFGCSDGATPKLTRRLHFRKGVEPGMCPLPVGSGRHLYG